MNAFIDEKGVLVCFGNTEANGNAIPVPVADDFRLEAGKWQWDGKNWLMHLATSSPV